MIFLIRIAVYSMHKFKSTNHDDIIIFDVMNRIVYFQYLRIIMSQINLNVGKIISFFFSKKIIFKNSDKIYVITYAKKKPKKKLKILNNRK